jgi:Fe-S cluster assembly iron-binding protein IscA
VDQNTRAILSAKKGNGIMQRQLLAPLILTALFATNALAKERPVTDEERTKLAAAIAEQGCSGGEMEFDIDDNEFDVDDVRCNDGRKYDLTFDTSFKLIKKELED